MKNFIEDRTDWCEIWNRFRSGDQAAFREIYNEFIDSLFAYGCKFIHDRDLVKDCIQDVFIDLQRLQPDIHHPEYLEFYLFKSLKNAILHKIDQYKKRNVVSIQEMTAFDVQFDEEQEPFDREYDFYRIKKLKAILENIDAQKRELLFLKFHTSLSYVEIGRMMNMAPDTVKKQVYRTLDHLRLRYGHLLINLLMINSKK